MKNYCLFLLLYSAALYPMQSPEQPTQRTVTLKPETEISLGIPTTIIGTLITAYHLRQASTISWDMHFKPHFMTSLWYLQDLRILERSMARTWAMLGGSITFLGMALISDGLYGSKIKEKK